MTQTGESSTMKHSILLGLTVSALAPMISLPESSHAQVRIRDLQQTIPGITVSGKVTNVVGNSFVLDDGSGQIIVDAGPRWWQPINVAMGEQLTVRGEVEPSGEFDAFSITRSNGSVINIRPAEGPPPWAGGRGRGRPRSPR